ncbi:MAG TPA: mechanosensitive ion channel [Fulvivirga sp.]|nr:mechanosensitive ion channel [Fulvivirga sp.]
MIENKLQIIETVVIIGLYFILKYIASKIINKVGKKFAYPRIRVNMVNKMVNGILFIVLTGIALFIWGVDQDQLVYFTTTLLTVVGIAFFAQWSIISNITSTLIIYFSHPVRVGDAITVLDKDYQIEGRITDISIFFLTLKTAEDEEITMPSNVFMQKLIKKKGTKKKVK